MTLVEATSLEVGDTIKINGSLYKVKEITTDFAHRVWLITIADMSGKLFSLYVNEDVPLYAELELGPMEGDVI